MRRQRSLTLLAVLALTGGIGACGSDDELSVEIPKTTPDLTIPTGTTPAPAPATTTATTSTTDASPTQPAPPPAAAAPPAVTPPAPPAGSPTTGGQTPQAPATGQSTTGGAQAGGGEFEDFCAQNPGAC